MARGKMKDRKLAFWKNDSGFMKDIGVFTMKAEEAKIFANSVEVREAQKAFQALKLEMLTVVEFPEIKDHKRKAKTNK